MSRTIEEINDALKEKKIEARVRQKISYAKKNWPEKLAEYEEREKQLKGRNSLSKTDPDATFMRMKEDHMRNGQLKPAYNIQASTNRQYIVDYTLGQKTTGTSLLKDHIDDFIASYGHSPESLTADAGYGSEENYAYLEQFSITPFVKYGYFDKEQKEKKHLANPFHPDNLHYDQTSDRYTCPMGQTMSYIGDKTRRTANGYLQTHRMYKAKNCSGCPLRGPCHKAQGERIIQRSPNLVRYKQKVRELLTSEEGLEKRRQRWQVEAVFGNIKQNKGFRRFSLRGIEKVNLEFGLIALAHNLQRFSTNH